MKFDDKETVNNDKTVKAVCEISFIKEIFSHNCFQKCISTLKNTRPNNLGNIPDFYEE